MRSAFLVCLVALTACGPTTGDACRNGTCQGCCTSDGRCESGVSQLACGQSGDQCTQCTLGTTCTFGLCTANNVSGGGGGTSTGGGAGGGGGATAARTVTNCGACVVNECQLSNSCINNSCEGSPKPQGTRCGQMGSIGDRNFCNGGVCVQAYSYCDYVSSSAQWIYQKNGTGGAGNGPCTCSSATTLHYEYNIPNLPIADHDDACSTCAALGTRRVCF